VIVGITMVRDEADVVGTVLRHLVEEGVDHLIVADNLSTDDTPAILLQLVSEGAPLTVVQDDEVGYYQARKMSWLAFTAHSMGADWVLPFDADEVWYGLNGTIAESLAQVDDGVNIVRAGGWDHVVRHDSGGTPFATWNCPPPFSCWRRPQMQQLAKVAFRAHPRASLHMGNHDVNLPGSPETDARGVLEFRHFQYRSLEQMTRKLRNGRQAYEASDIHPMHGTHWRAGGLKSDAELAADWAALCAEEGLVFDPAPLRVPVA
jgi:hypothetical protein